MLNEHLSKLLIFVKFVIQYLCSWLKWIILFLILKNVEDIKLKIIWFLDKEGPEFRAIMLLTMILLTFFQWILYKWTKDIFLFGVLWRTVVLQRYN